MCLLRLSPEETHLTLPYVSEGKSGVTNCYLSTTLERVARAGLRYERG